MKTKKPVAKRRAENEGSRAATTKTQPLKGMAVHDALVTAAERLLRAGMVNLGKTHMVEFAFGGWALILSWVHPGTPGISIPIAHLAALQAVRVLLLLRPCARQPWVQTPAVRYVSPHR